jgi:putative ABC transport system permease protein
MSWIRFFRRRYWDQERARELESYLDIETADNIGRGLSSPEARRAAYRKLGNPTRIREEIYHMNTLGLVDTVAQDLRYGARLLRRNPLFAGVAILTLALGSGANTAIFQLVNAVRLRTLPVENPHELVEIAIDTHDKGRTGRFTGRRPRLSHPVYERIRQEQQVFSGIAVWGSVTFDLSQGGESRPVQGMWVNGEFFNALGVKAQAGRLFTAADDVRGCASPAVVLSSAFWHREYGANPAAIGRTLRLDGFPYEIAGVAPDSFFGVDVGQGFDVAVPLCAEPHSRGLQTGINKPDTWFLAALGRLKPGVHLTAAESHLRTISSPIFQATLPSRYTPDDAKSYLAFTLIAIPAGTGVSSLRTAYATPLWILLGATAVVLLVACANLANLMLARATTREREIAVRLAIGASRRRVVRQMLSESLLIAALGTAAGLLLASWLSRTLVAFLSTGNNQLFLDLVLDWRVFGFTAGLAVTACLLFGLTPALRATVTDPGATIKASGRGTTDTRERFSVRRALVVVQVALSLVLVVGAGLFGQSLRNLLTLDPGFRHQNLLVVNMDVRRAGVAVQQRPLLYDRIVERLASLPGVASTSQVAILPVGGSVWNNRIIVGGVTQQTFVNFNSVGRNYFRTMGISMVGGRDFSRDDRLTSPKVTIINELFARTFFSGQSPIGQSFQVEAGPGEPQRSYEIVGVVKDSKYRDLRSTIPPQAFLPASQDSEPDPSLQAVIRTALPASTVSAEVTTAVREIHPSILLQFSTLEQTIRSSLTSERLMATLSGFFGGLAMLIATIGLYGVMSYTAEKRRMEIGIRIALGADRAAVVRMIVGEAAKLLVISLPLGVALSLSGGYFAAALLYGLKPWDPTTLVIATAGLGLVATLASWIPAQRAARLEPTAALRQE